MTCGVYAIWVGEGDIERPYIGSSNNLELREKQHFSKLKFGTHPNYKLRKAGHRVGVSFRFEKLFECSKEDRPLLEEMTIAVFDSFHNGYNLTPNVLGSINLGLTLKPQHRKAISLAAKKRYEDYKEHSKTSESLKEYWCKLENREEVLQRYRTVEYRDKMRVLILQSWGDEEIRERRTKALAVVTATEGYHQRLSLSLLGKPKTETHRKNISSGAKKKYSDPLERLKTSESLQTPEAQKKLSEAGKRCWSTPEMREHLRAARKSKWADPIFRAMMSEKLKKAWEKRKNSPKTSQNSGELGIL